MEYKRSLALILAVVGIFLVIVQPFSPTGAVIDLSTSSAKVSFIVGLVMVIGGIVILLAERGEGGLTKRVNRAILN